MSGVLADLYARRYSGGFQGGFEFAGSDFPSTGNRFGLKFGRLARVAGSRCHDGKDFVGERFAGMDRYIWKGPMFCWKLQLVSGDGEVGA